MFRKMMMIAAFMLMAMAAIAQTTFVGITGGTTGRVFALDAQGTIYRLDGSWTLLRVGAGSGSPDRIIQIAAVGSDPTGAQTIVGISDGGRGWILNDDGNGNVNGWRPLPPNPTPALASVPPSVQSVRMAEAKGRDVYDISGRKVKVDRPGIYFTAARKTILVVP